ncbi:MAG: phytoene desaturase [Sumerlaeia bacterium]
MPSKALVIGAGFGGIAAALRLRAKGHDVTLLDRLDKLGGRAYVFERDGFTFDAGPTVVTAPYLFDELFALFGKKREDYVEFVPCKPWYRIRFADGRTFEYGGTMADMEAEIARFEPSDVAGYRRFMAHTRKIYEIGYLQLGDQPFNKLGTMLGLTPRMVGLESYLSVYRRACKYLKNDYLRRVFSFQPLLVGGNPATTTSIYSLIQTLEMDYGVWYAMGGTGAIVRAFGRLMEEEGIAVRLESTVEEILVRDGKARGARLAGGEELAADIVVCNADAPAVYRNLLPAQHRRKWTDRRVEKLRYSMGLFVMYFGAKKTWPDLAHHTILLADRYIPLIDDIFDKPDIAEDFSLYLHAPTRTDPSMAPPGHECFYVLCPVPNLKNGAAIDWAVEGPKLRDRILEFLDEEVVPGLRENLTTEFHVTPEYFRDNLLTHHGTGFSIQPVLTQSAYFRFHNQSEDIGDLYFVGAGTHPGAGMPGVLSSAKVVERILDGDLTPRRDCPVPAPPLAS